jgi:hypothetical protein
MGHEGAGRRAAIERLKHGGLDLKKAPIIQKRPYRANHPAPPPKEFANFGVDRQIRISLPEPGRLILKSGVHEAGPGLRVRLLFAERERPQRLGKDLPRRDPNGYLTGSRPKDNSRHADPVSKVEEVQLRKGHVAEDLLAKVELQAPSPVFQMSEGRLSMAPPREQTPGQTHGGSIALLREFTGGFRTLEGFSRLLGIRTPVESIGIGFDPEGPEAIQFLPSMSQELR